jgi:hypothetical protein
MTDSRDALKFMAAASVIRLSQPKPAATPAKPVKKKRRAVPQPASSSTRGKPSSHP